MWNGFCWKVLACPKTPQKTDKYLNMCSIFYFVSSCGKKVGDLLNRKEMVTSQRHSPRGSAFMRNSNISRMDSKGRLLIPAHIRGLLNVDEGTEIMILPGSEKSEARILPLVRDKTMELRITMADSPGSLAVIADMLAKYNIGVLMSKSRSIIKGKTAEWDLIVDTSECSGKIERMKSLLLSTRLIKSMEILTP